MAKNSKSKDKPVGWRIPAELRERINFKAKSRGQDAEDFVIECMEANTQELKPIQKQIIKEHREAKKPIVV